MPIQLARLGLRRRACVLAILIMTAANGTFAIDDPTEPAKLFEPREFAGKTEATQGQVLKYRLLKPLDFDPSEKYPLVVFFHGAGERGMDNTAQLVHGMADFCDPEVRKKFPCYVLAPQCPKDQKWADVDWTQAEVTRPKHTAVSMQLSLDLIDEMLEHSAVDPRRVYITGLSMGGYGTWDALSRRPKLFAAAVPICGGGDLATADVLASTPIWCFHGAKDNVVDVELSRQMVASIKAAGGQPLYTEYPEATHNSWTATYANRDMIEWMFQQRRPATSEAQEQPKMREQPSPK